MSAENIELKCRLADEDAARQIAKKISTAQGEILEQVDTYFFCRTGRLKMRQINRRDAELIWYQRPDHSDSKLCTYTRVELENGFQVGAKETQQPGEAILESLSKVLGVEAVVKKRRELFFYQNVRIHLDQVERLGAFMEFESVLGAQVKPAQGYEQLAWLQSEFQLKKTDLVEGSYRELILAQALQK